MCQYTYHHYRDCGHISSFTMDSCVEIFNFLRLTASADTSLSCTNIRTRHDQLPVDYKTQCLQCELDWSRHVATYGIPPIAHCHEPCIPIEGTDYSAPIVVTRMEMHLDKPAMAMCSEFDRAYFKEEPESGELTCDEPQDTHVSDQEYGCVYGSVMQTPRYWYNVAEIRPEPLKFDNHEVISVCLDTSCSDDSVKDSDLCEDYEVVENTDQTDSNDEGSDMDDFDSCDSDCSDTDTSDFVSVVLTPNPTKNELLDSMTQKLKQFMLSTYTHEQLTPYPGKTTQSPDLSVKPMEEIRFTWKQLMSTANTPDLSQSKQRRRAVSDSPGLSSGLFLHGLNIMT